MRKESVEPLSDEAIVEGLRHRNSRITRDYFYGYCRIAWHIYDKHYGLRDKQGMDFYSIAHEYYLSLDRHDFKPLEDRRREVSLKTWMINGFRFVLLDRLKAYHKEHHLAQLEGDLRQTTQGFDMPDDTFQEDFRNTVYELCHDVFGRDSKQSLILQMMLIEGFKGKEVATQLGVSPSAIAQRFHKMMDEVVVPYFREYYEAPTAITAHAEVSAKFTAECDSELRFGRRYICYEPMNILHRITPQHVKVLAPDQIFVFGSNLAGMHGGGAARTARLYFGAVMGNGEGPQGQCYAIPTMQGGVETIKPYVDQFIAYAKAHPSQTFLVTAIGCGIAGFYPEDIAPLFETARHVDNIHLPAAFWKVLEDYV
jgi:DNA-directed RNA polymerase specialized sigma24 family protein